MTPIVAVRNLSKSFPGVRALDNCQFELMPGEVHGLVGENGAGKSTLMKILAGVYRKDAGEILFDGRPVEIDTPRAAQALGIRIIHQELNLMNHLSAARNIFIGAEPLRAWGLLVDEKRLHEDAQRIFDRLRLKLDPRTPVGELTVARQQLVEVAKALAFDARMLIMDEPTAALNQAEVDDLFRIIDDLRAHGVAVVYISHKMAELKRISDRMTILRDGRYIATVATAETKLDDVIAMMVGRELEQGAAAAPAGGAGGEVVLEVRNLQRAKVLKDVSFVARKGEILGLAGLMGAGRTELARAVFGADPIDSGEILVHGRRVRVHSPSDAVRHGIGYLSEDRKRLGLVIQLDVRTNVVLASLRKFLSLGFFVRSKPIDATAGRAVRTLGIKTPSLRQSVALLSGGNQQKVVIAKWLERDCEILFFDEPTRGIDVGAKREIYKLLELLAAQGRAIVMISSELPEILRVSHRILVMCEGRITGEVDRAQASQERIMQLATQQGAPA